MLSPNRNLSELGQFVNWFRWRNRLMNAPTKKGGRGHPDREFHPDPIEPHDPTPQIASDGSTGTRSGRSDGEFLRRDQQPESRRSGERRFRFSPQPAGGLPRRGGARRLRLRSVPQEQRKRAIRICSPSRTNRPVGGTQSFIGGTWHRKTAILARRAMQ